jgi:DNA relaxase NicK
MFFLDWIQFTIKVDTAVPGVALAYFYKVVNVELEESKHTKGFNGYKQMCEFPSGIKVMFDGMDGMGINVSIPPKALDSAHFYDSIEQIEERLEVLGRGYKWTRLDFAVDTYKHDFSVFYDKYLAKEYRCKYRDQNIRQNVDANNRGTLYFGKRGSLTMFRIYDKGLEQGTEDIWTRVELESRDEACIQLLEAYKKGELNKYFLGHLDFVKERETNMSRCETAEFYLEVLEGGAEKRKVQRDESDKTLEWFVKQVAPTVKALKKYYGQDFVDKIVDGSKISNRQLKERFDLEILSPYEGLNRQTGEVTKLSKEYTQMCLEQIFSEVV